MRAHWRNPRDLSRPRIGAMHQVRRRWRISWPVVIVALLAIAVFAVLFGGRLG